MSSAHLRLLFLPPTLTPFILIVCLKIFSMYKLKRVGDATHPCITHRCTVEPLSNDHPHQRPSLLYDHISCDGQCFLFVRSLTNDHPSNATSDRVRWNFLPRRQPHRVFQNDCGMNVRCRAAHFTYNFNRW